MVIRHRQRSAKDESILIMTPEALARTVEDFLAGARDAIVLDDGAAVFDLAQAKYSISGEHNKCLLHFWSAERNLVRRVLDVDLEEVRDLGHHREVGGAHFLDETKNAKTVAEERFA